MSIKLGTWLYPGIFLSRMYRTASIVRASACDSILTFLVLLRCQNISTKECVFLVKYQVGASMLHLSLRGSGRKILLTQKSWLLMESVTLYNIELERFIEKYGTHIVTSVRMGGNDVVYVKQHNSSPLALVEVQKILKDVADKRFSDACGQSSFHLEKTYDDAMVVLERIEQGLTFMDSSTLSIYCQKENITFFWRRKGGSSSRNMRHDKWCHSVKLEPEMISMSFILISSLLNGIEGNGYLDHAINLYLRYKPPIEVLYQFLDFQLPKQWAPMYGDFPLGPVMQQKNDARLQFSFLGPKLYVNANMVDVRKRLVTGARLYLEGKRSNRLGIHLQHLTTSSKFLQLQNELDCESSYCSDTRYHEKVVWKIFSHICTSPVESDDDLSVVTGAQFEVKKSGIKDVLILKLHFSRANGALVLKKTEWDSSSDPAEKSGLFTSLVNSISKDSGNKSPESTIDINSAIYPERPPILTANSQLLKFVNTKEMTRGSQDPLNSG